MPVKVISGPDPLLFFSYRGTWEKIPRYISNDAPCGIDRSLVKNGKGVLKLKVYFTYRLRHLWLYRNGYEPKTFIPEP
jgi:hypothetical protein